MLTNIEASGFSIFISFFVSLLLSFGFYLRDKNISETASFIKYILITSRFFVLFTVLFLLFNPLFNTKKEISNPPKIICLVDNSESMILNDSLIADNIKKKLNYLHKSIANNATIEVFTFGNALKKSDSTDFKGKKSDLLDAISSVAEIEQNKNISGLVILSDGIITSGGVELFNPMGTPVYSIGMGDTGQIKDAMIKNIYHNDITYSGNDFPIEINCSIKKMKGVKQHLKLFFEGDLRFDTVFTASNDNYNFKYTNLVKANEPGTKKISVLVENNVKEKIIINNRIQRYITVLDSKQNIAFVYDAPHPDIRALKSVFYGDESFSVEDFKFSDSCPDLSLFNALIFVGASDQNSMNRWRTESSKKQVGGFWITGVSGEFNFRKMTLERLDNSKDEAYLSIEKGFSLFKINDALGEFLNNAPPLSVPFGKWRISNISQTLATQNIGGVTTNYPLITFASSGNVKSAYLLGEGIWRWKLQEKGNSNQFDNFFKKVIQYLSVKEEKSAFRLKYEKIISNNDKVIIESEYYNPSFELDNSGLLNLQLIDNEGNKFEYEFLKSGKKYRIDLGVLKEGNYELVATKTTGGKPLIKKGKLLVEGKSIESLNLQANYNGMKSLSEKSFGKFYYENQFNVFLDDISIQDNFKTLTYNESVKEQLLKNKWILFLLITLLGVEWFIRKWEGVI